MARCYFTLMSYIVKCVLCLTNWRMLCSYVNRYVLMLSFGLFKTLHIHSLTDLFVQLPRCPQTHSIIRLGELLQRRMNETCEISSRRRLAYRQHVSNVAHLSRCCVMLSMIASCFSDLFVSSKLSPASTM